MKKEVALVTGGSRGIGAAIVKKLKELDCSVLAPTRNELDLLSNDSIDSFISSIDSPIDILVNNAGINPLGSCTDIKEKDINDTIQVNLIAPLRLIKGIAPGMINKKYGRIINISSILSKVSKEKRVIYSSTKSAINGMTRSIAIELSKYNILVNSIAPGYVNTELTKQNNSDDDLKKIAKLLPIGRLAEPSEIAEFTAFLCSDKNTYITGQTIVIDGGFTCL